jgi:hypothetical protein
MAKRAALRVSDVLMVPDSSVLPASFVEAVKAGWKIAKETTVVSVDRRHRHGKVILQKRGFERRLSVPYTSSVKLGYTFGKPELL